MAAARQTRHALIERASIYTALGDETRLRLVNRLSATGPLSITKLAVHEPMTRQAVSKHLRTLQQAGLVHSRRTGRERIWELRPMRLAEVRRHLDEIARQWDQAIGRLRRAVEKE